jgi:tetratricopeptide (TPR) repeat protein
MKFQKNPHFSKPNKNRNFAPSFNYLTYLMQKYLITLLSITVLFVGGCSPAIKLTKTQQAKQAFDAGKLETSLQLYEEIIAAEEEAGTLTEANHYEEAGKTAEALGDMSKAESYYKLAIYYKTASADVYQKLAAYYRQQTNISKESGMLEPLVSLFPESSQAKAEKARLYQIYFETEQWEKAVALWPPNTGAAQDESLLNTYFIAQKKLGNDEQLDTLSSDLLALNPENKAALEWKAITLYNKGENRYQKEIQEYENNKTNSQYKIMLAGLDTATAYFKQSLQILEQLYGREADKRYALYIANIYARFGDEPNAKRYQKLSQ